MFATDDTRKRLRFHDLRGTGLTWMAIRGDDPLKIQQRAGHRTFEMTQKYIRTAEAVGQVIGATFPPLPDCLIAGRYRQRTVLYRVIQQHLERFLQQVHDASRKCLPKYALFCVADLRICIMHSVALGLGRSFAVNARWRAAAPAQNAIATQTKRR